MADLVALGRAFLCLDSGFRVVHASAALDELINLGYLRGILNKLAEIERLDAKHGEFVRVLRDLARQFQFEAMKEILRKMRDEPR